MLRANKLAITTILCSLAGSAIAEDVRSGMGSILPAFKAIQPYIASQAKFGEKSNESQINEIIRSLRDNFHKLENVPTSYHYLPGFDENLKSVSELLDDAGRRFSEGKSSYAWWRLRKLPSDCFTCHATYKVSSHYSNSSVIDESLDSLNKARFQLATRQFSEAKTSFLEVLKDPTQELSYNEALRSILLITIRIDRDPKAGIALFERILENAKLLAEDAREARAWIKDLRSWSNEKPSEFKDSIALAEQLIRSGTSSSQESDVVLLRGTAILHDQIEHGQIHRDVRPRALYLLGLAYTKLPLFFSESWAEMYLERCIKEFPGSWNAKLAYGTYRDQVTADYTGTAGTDIPAEVKLHLEELRRKAYGETGFTGIVKHSGTDRNT